VLPDAELLDSTASGMREMNHPLELPGFGHDPGAGPLRAGLPFQVDLFPCDDASGCCARPGRELYDATCDLFEAAGHAPQRTSDPDDTDEGFQFALAHGAGLEPGLWDVRMAGVRFEDLVLVTDDGSETLTRFPYALTPGT
jgi:Xaa-Pro aminopeptidase